MNLTARYRLLRRWRETQEFLVRSCSIIILEMIVKRHIIPTDTIDKTYFIGIIKICYFSGVIIMKKFFKIEHKYKFEWNDLRCLLQLINVALIVFWSFDVGAIFGLVVATLGLIKDFTTDRHINGIVMHLASIMLNC